MYQKYAALLYFLAFFLFQSVIASAELLGLQDDVRYYYSNGRLGLADESGTHLTDAVYEEAYPFEFELAVVCRDGQYGVIDKMGCEIVQCEWDSVIICENAIIVETENGQQLLNHCGIPISDVYPLIYENLEYFVISNYAYYGLIDTEGNEVLSMCWSSIGSSTDGLAVVANEDYKCNILMIESGDFLLADWVDNCTVFSDGWSACLNDDKVFFVDRHGSIIATSYTYVDWYPEGGEFVVQDEQGQWYLFNPAEQRTTSVSAETVLLPREGLAPVQINGKWGYCDLSGMLVIPCIYDSVSSFRNGRAYVNIGDFYYYITSDGECIGNQAYLFANPFSEGYAACLDINTEKVGFIDLDGNWYIEPQYLFNGSTWFSDGVCILSLPDEQTVVINLQGDILSIFTTY